MHTSSREVLTNVGLIHIKRPTMLITCDDLRSIYCTYSQSKQAKLSYRDTDTMQSKNWLQINDF